DGYTDIHDLLWGKSLAFLLMLVLGWAYFRLVLALADAEDHLRWRDIAVSGALAVGVVACHLPWFSPDVFFYFGTGWLDVHYHANPYTHAIYNAPGHETDPAFQNVFHLWRLIITPYAPLFVKFVGLVTWLADGDDRIALVILKAFFVLFHIANVGL